MATYTAANATAPVFSYEAGNQGVYVDSAATTAALSSADVIKLVKVPAGIKVNRVVIKNPDLDASTALTAKIGFSYVDGTAVASGVDAIVAADGAWGQSAATTTYEIFPPVRLERDAFLTLVVGTGGTTNTGTVYGKVEGELTGTK